MAQPHEEIQSFLSSSETTPSESNAVALLFAQSMCRELRLALAEWEEAAATLQQLSRDQFAPSSN